MRFRMATAGFLAFTFAFTQIIPTQALAFLESPALAAPKYHHGTLKDSFQGSKNQEVILIQDAHSDEPTQLAIEKLLGEITKHEKIDFIGLEGYWSQAQREVLKFVSDPKKNRDILLYILKHGEISGAELFAATNAPAKLRFEGVEDKALFRKYFLILQELLSRQDEVEAFTKSTRQKLIDSANKELNPKLKELLRDEETFSGQGRNLPVHLEKLRKLYQSEFHSELTDLRNQIQYPMILRIFALKKDEKKLDLVKAAWEMKSWANDLESSGLAKSFEKELNSLQGEIEGKSSVRTLSIRGLLESLWDKSRKTGRSLLAGENLKAYFRFHLLEEELVGEKLFDEIESLTESLTQKLAASEKERKFLERWQDAKLLTRLLKLQLTYEDWQRVRSSDFSRWLGALASAPEKERINSLLQASLSFYRGAGLRDQAMLKNLEKHLQTTRAKKAILITGGFHTGPIKQALRERGISFREITPVRGAETQEGFSHLAGKLTQIHYQDAILNRSIMLPRIAAMPDEGKAHLDSRGYLDLTPQNILSVGQLAEQGMIDLKGGSTKIPNPFLEALRSGKVPVHGVEKNLVTTGSSLGESMGEPAQAPYFDEWPEKLRARVQGKHFLQQIIWSTALRDLERARAFYQKLLEIRWEEVQSLPSVPRIRGREAKVWFQDYYRLRFLAPPPIGYGSGGRYIYHPHFYCQDILIALDLASGPGLIERRVTTRRTHGFNYDVNVDFWDILCLRDATQYIGQFRYPSNSFGDQAHNLHTLGYSKEIVYQQLADLLINGFRDWAHNLDTFRNAEKIVNQHLDSLLHFRLLVTQGELIELAELERSRRKPGKTVTASSLGVREIADQLANVPFFYFDEQDKVQQKADGEDHPLLDPARRIEFARLLEEGEEPIGVLEWNNMNLGGMDTCIVFLKGGGFRFVHKWPISIWSDDPTVYLQGSKVNKNSGFRMWPGETMKEELVWLEGAKPVLSKPATDDRPLYHDLARFSWIAWSSCGDAERRLKDYRVAASGVRVPGLAEAELTWEELARLISRFNPDFKDDPTYGFSVLLEDSSQWESGKDGKKTVRLSMVNGGLTIARSNSATPGDVIRAVANDKTVGIPEPIKSAFGEFGKKRGVHLSASSLGADWVPDDDLSEAERERKYDARKAAGRGLHYDELSEAERDRIDRMREAADRGEPGAREQYLKARYGKYDAKTGRLLPEEGEGSSLGAKQTIVSSAQAAVESITTHSPGTITTIAIDYAHQLLAPGIAEASVPAAMGLVQTMTQTTGVASIISNHPDFREVRSGNPFVQNFFAALQAAAREHEPAFNLFTSDQLNSEVIDLLRALHDSNKGEYTLIYDQGMSPRLRKKLEETFAGAEDRARFKIIDATRLSPAALSQVIQSDIRSEALLKFAGQFRKLADSRQIYNMITVNASREILDSLARYAGLNLLAPVTEIDSFRSAGTRKRIGALIVERGLGHLLASYRGDITAIHTKLGRRILDPKDHGLSRWFDIDWDSIEEGVLDRIVDAFRAAQATAHSA